MHLKTNGYSPTDNFFDVGGNSLMAISVFSRISSAFNLDLGLRYSSIAQGLMIWLK